MDPCFRRDDILRPGLDPGSHHVVITPVFPTNLPKLLPSVMMSS